MKNIKIKISDLVFVKAGKDKGKIGQVIKIFPDVRKAEVQGVNTLKKNAKPSKKYPKGGIIDISHPIDASNLALVCPSCRKITKIKIERSNKKVTRICQKCQADLSIKPKPNDK
ncbi:50S ribosomal protein L24 [Candidatus Berkelbacteria bacterium CG2_30_39_44]|uniref:Large ribosomal subunit protein uL24 n=1 Tax=Candidatus Berkelbacteria bacterium CG03_land_8_20_14_0_80_40_36 TaxID=1974509 RepID=A0A2M7CJ67_9BACT|nr:MAG: 50S ribosomal protein L24 [Candidatus Berkelbacteria bacterium CG2_30_39_44]PIV25672.1 MAG: 50S ribosomal protein L24 [Candidatus Berkelbacteria bacterium CG03_land_8_20_14_0_80_40_36]PIX30722.1 MAG: 50S ribosomal protein L24 [Candidatus Berkelbacteria bacterium CG_4_8_14_3_um_filter_39_27]PIZ28892.1 MAG: 50S ribosomal protein L24 [Candidatus Berkelbacteria bacterium CG_4_10_14_0_8_um_filter_39_42]